MRLIDADELKEKVINLPIFAILEQEQILTDGTKSEFVSLVNNQSTINQWHYPSKGEYPTELDRYLCLIDKNMPMVLEYTEEDDGTKVWFDELGGDVIDSVYAWQYIIPPKEEA